MHKGSPSILIGIILIIMGLNVRYLLAASAAVFCTQARVILVKGAVSEFAKFPSLF